jgi:hypothetical protein
MTTRPLLLFLICGAAGMLLAALARPAPASAIEINDPNLSRDAAYCRSLTATFRQAIGGRTGDAALDETRKTGERGAYLCRFERYREGITMLERALTSLRETPSR